MTGKIQPIITIVNTTPVDVHASLYVISVRRYAMKAMNMYDVIVAATTIKKLRVFSIVI